MAEQAERSHRLERMSLEDLDEIHRMEKACFSSPWPKNVFRSVLVDQSAFAYVARLDHSIDGYVVSWLDRDQIIIANLAVRPAARRRGLGRQLLTFAMETGARAGASWAVLDVRESNSNAIRLYAEMGFRARGRRPGYYSNPDEDSLVMWRPLV